MSRRFAGGGADWPLALALALLCGFVLQIPDLLLHKVSWNLDLRVHYNYAREYAAALDAGQWRPRWAWMAQDGLGEPGLLYYAPLYYYASWAVSQLTGNVWQAMQWVEIASAGLLGWSVWKLASEQAPPRLALMAIPLAVFAPMLALLSLGFNGYPWASATGPLGLLVWALFRKSAQDRVIDPWAMGALALVICTHTVTGLMAVIMVAACGIPPLLRRPKAFWRERDFLRPFLGAIGGLLLSAWYLLPAFASQGMIDAGVWRENFTPYDAFSLSTLSAWAHGIRWFAFQWPISLLALGGCVLALWFIGRSRAARPVPHWLAPVTAIVAVTGFLATELSYPLWLVDSPLRNIQFPHRLITLLVPILPLLLVAALARVEGLRSWIFAGIMATSCAMGVLVVAKSATIDGKVEDFSERSFEPYEGLDEYRTTTAAARGNSGNDFDPVSECARVEAICSPSQIDASGRRWTVDLPKPATLRLPAYAFPALQALRNGQPLASRADEELGLIEVDLPAGRSEVTVVWQYLPSERWGGWISLLAVLLIGAGAFAARRKRPYSSTS